MNDALRLTVVVYALGLAVVCAWLALSGRRRPSNVTASLAVLQVGVVLQALVDIVTVARGHQRGSLTVHLAYLAMSLAIIPLFAGSVKMDPRRWGSIALAIGCALLAVVSIRLDQTLTA